MSRLSTLQRALKTLSLTALILITSGVSAQAAPTFSLPGESFSLSDMAPHRQSGEGYGEKYTFDAELEGEHKGSLYFSMMITNLGSGDHKMTAQGRLTLDQESYKWKSKRDDDEWSSSKSPLMIKAGSVSLSDEGGLLTFKVSHRDYELVATMKPIVSMWQPKGGGLSLGKHKTLYQLLPLTETIGTLTLKGETPQVIHFKGKGWGSHTASGLGPHEQQLWTSKLRAIDLKRNRTLYWRTVKLTKDHGGAQRSYLLLTEGDKVLFEGVDVNPTVHKRYIDKKKYDYQVPEELELDVVSARDPNVRLKGTVKTLKRTRRRDPIAKRSWAERLVIERFSKPMEYTYKVGYDLTLSGADAPLTLKGKGQYEVFHFNKD